MKCFEKDIWKEDEYTYRAGYGFIPNIHAYLHDDDTKRDCMIVVPGGGYCMCVPSEAEIVAKVFYEQGMNAFVLSYTTDITMSVPLKRQPMEDISRAVRLIRKNENEYNIAGKKIIICGFSAGAHVCGSLAVHFDDIKDSDESLDKVSNRPDGVILSYPVITSGEYTHEFSIQALLGKNPSKEDLEYFSLEKNVKDNTPPCFIWQTQTDDLVPVENSYMFAKALKEKNIYYAHYVFPTGIHGLSVANDDFFNARFGEPYTMKQVFMAVDAVKAGKGVDVSDERKKELEIQFGGDVMAPPEIVHDKNLRYEVGLWPKLAEIWMERIQK
jgi:acetyl esterase/lipase